MTSPHCKKCLARAFPPAAALWPHQGKRRLPTRHAKRSPNQAWLLPLQTSKIYTERSDLATFQANIPFGYVKKIPEGLYTTPNSCNSVACRANTSPLNATSTNLPSKEKNLYEIYMAGNPLTAFPAYLYATLLFTHSQSMVALSHRSALSVKAGANVVTAGRTWRGQADLDLDTRKETIFLLCLTSFLPWVHLQAPICHHILPASIPVAFSSCTQSSPECHRTVHYNRRTMLTIKPTSV